MSDPGLVKSPSGISGLDEITRGGLPSGRPTLVVGDAGCGKSLMAMSFLVRGALDYDEPGVFVSFEETLSDLSTNMYSLGIDLPGLIEQHKLVVEHVDIDPFALIEAGDFDLQALFLRIGAAIDEVGAKRVVLDTIETLFAGFENRRRLRAELVRLFRWLKDRGVTTIITGERGGSPELTRQGIEEYVSDCVVVLEHRVSDGISTRSIRVAKYRGTAHETNEYPFIIDRTGFVVLPITSIGLDHSAPEEVISTGVAGLDAMIAGGGLFRGSSILVSGAAGSGKTSFAASLLSAACDRGESAILFSFEESREQLVRNMASIGIDLATPLETGKLSIRSTRPTLYGLETHLAHIYNEVKAASPDVVAIDPMTSLLSAGTYEHARAVLLRLVDFLKSSAITAVFTSLGHGGSAAEMSESQVSSLMDTWLSLRVTEANGERNRELYILKSRGMGHSNQVREFTLSKRGMELLRPYVGIEGVLTGSARLVQEIKERAETDLRRSQISRLRQQIEQRQVVLNAEIEKIRAEFEQERHQLMASLAEAEAMEKTLEADLQYLARRRTDPNPSEGIDE